MAIHRKVYRFRMRPTKVQEQALNRLAGARRWVWNWALARWKDTYAATGKSISLKQLSAELTALKEKPETAWLKEADSQALQQVLQRPAPGFQQLLREACPLPSLQEQEARPAAVSHPAAGQDR